MAKILKVGQFGHTFTRGMEEYVKTVEQRIHHVSDGTIKLYKFITFYIAFPIIGLTMANCYLKHKEEHSKPPPKFVHYPYLKIMNKPFPWGDGKHSLFHNPRINYIPGIGYEEEH
ncbi:cytochrome c oxidase subunit 6A1, mitochondrial-like [Apis laboriosa]|uniref:cytochrome c oxidase subunit 6A1, mitochondrial-like n=1 Tax=Apis laboriosa TaxID=183418 RepID=UPI001CC56CCB|nr:cytochrome c oxidase subunit 6A1, mitochondrial-like [Apis laboriosa]